jgi:dCMP deaminase
MTEPKCEFCDTYDKHRCKTLAQATGCHAYGDAHTRIPDTDYVEEPSPVAMRPGFDEWALSLAVAVSDRSRDPSTKVGAVIIRADKTICSMGYNGFPRQMEDKPEWWNDRPQKYARVIHAEMNAILNAPESVRGMTLYVTHPVCENCAKHIAAAGITRIVWGSSDEIRERFDVETSLGLLADCGIEVKEIEYGRNDNNAPTGGQGAETSSCKTC